MRDRSARVCARRDRVPCATAARADGGAFGARIAIILVILISAFAVVIFRFGKVYITSSISRGA